MRNLILALGLILAPLCARAQALGPIPPTTLPIAQENGGTSVDPASMQAWRAALAGVQAGMANATVVYIGDSTVQSAEVSTYGDSPKNVTYWLSLYLNSVGIPANQNGFCGLGGTTARTATDPRIAIGGWANSGIPTLGGPMLAASQAGSPLVYSPGVAWNTALVTYLGSPGNGAITATATGGGAVPINTSQATPGVYTATAAAASLSASNTVSLNFVSGNPAYVECLTAYNSAQKTVNIYNAGWFGSQMSQFIGNTNAWDPQKVLAGIAPPLTIIEGGINDGIAGTPVATFTANLQSVIETAELSGSVLLVTGDFAALPAFSNLIPYANAMRAAAAQDDIPIVSVDLRWKTTPAPASTVPPLVGPDGGHPSAVGAADIAWAVFQAITH